MRLRTKYFIRKWTNRIFWCAVLGLFAWANVYRFCNNVYSNYEKAVDYGIIREEKETIEPVMAAIFYKGKSTKKKNISTYLNHADNYKKQDVKMVVVPNEITKDSVLVLEKLYAEIGKYNDIKKIVLVSDTKYDVKTQKKLLQKVLKIKDVKILHLTEADISAEAKIENYLQKDKYLLVFMADIKKGLAEKTKNFMLEEVVYFAQKYFYHMQVFDVVDTEIAKSLDRGYEALLSIADEKPLLIKQKQNLDRYKSRYQDIIVEFFKKNFYLATDKKTIWPEKNARNYRLFDRGNVYLKMFTERGEEVFSRAKIGKNKSVIVSIIELARKAKHKVQVPVKYYRIYILTDMVRVYKGKEQILDDCLDVDDGVYAQYRSKSAIIAADERPKNPQDLVPLLKMVAKIPQKVDENSIKFYKFKTVEIEDEY